MPTFGQMEEMVLDESGADNIDSQVPNRPRKSIEKSMSDMMYQSMNHH